VNYSAHIFLTFSITAAMDSKAANRIKILAAIAKAKASGKRFTRAKREYVDITSKHLPTKRDFQESIVNYINKRK
jgi:hypothetical protein